MRAVQRAFRNLDALVGRGLSTYVRHDERHLLSSLKPGQTLQASPSEQAMLQVSRRVKGSTRVTNVLILETNDTAMLQSRFALAAKKLSFLQGFLRCTVEEEEENGHQGASPWKNLVLRVRDGVEIPSRVYSADGDVALVAQELWETTIEKVPLKLGRSIAQLDLVVGSGTAAILVTCEHALCDALSLSFVCHQLLGLLAGVEQTECSKLLPSFEHACGGLDPTLVSPVVLAQRQAALKQYAPANGGAPVLRFPLEEGQDALSNGYLLGQQSSSRIERVVLTGADTQLVTRACKAASITVTSALAASILRALVSVAGHGGQPDALVALACGADTRKLCTPPLERTTLSYHVSGVPTFACTVAETSDMHATAARYGRHLSVSLDSQFPLALSAFTANTWASTLDPAAKRPSSLPTALLTNWGRTDIAQRYGEMRVTCMFPLVSLGHTSFPVFMCSASAEKLVLSCITNKVLHQEEAARALLHHTQHNLRSLMD
jgi:hypothetical protein